MCGVCDKHQDLSKSTGEVIFEQGGWMLTHFPKIGNDLATKGHLLIETKRHITDLTEMSESEAEALGVVIHKGTCAVKKVLKAQRVYVYRINDVTPHLHFHLIPRYEHTPKEFWGLKIMQNLAADKIDLPEIQSLSSSLKKSLQN